jgi:alpha-1,2-mannosyltransferase
MAWGLWALFVLVITGLVARQPQRRRVTPNYVVGTRNCSARLDLYGPSAHGFLYPPQFAILYTPFARAPVPRGDVAWRWLNLGLFAGAIFRLARLARDSREPSAFLLLTALSIPASLSSAPNGQVNMTEAALLIHAGVDLARAPWRRARFSLTLGTFLKPIALVMALLAAVLRLPMLWRLPLAGLAGAALLFALASPSYVVRQYRGMVEKMQVASSPNAP